jgi:hypothetical protein
MYPQSSDGRNTFVIFADWVATLAAQPPAAPAERGCCNKCQKASECETGCKLACTCGGDPGQPASEHDISCPAGLQRSSADTAQELERLREVAHAVEGLLNADTYVSNVPRAEAVRNATIKLNQKLGIWQMHHTAQKAESAR